jgi:hypothetical protein
MSFKHGPALILLLMLIMVFGGVVVFCLPGFLERKTFPAIFENAGLHEYGIDVRRIGIAGIDLGRVTLGDAKEPWLSIAAIQVDYSLAGILAREIKSVTVSGLELEALVQDGRIVIPGLAMTDKTDSGPGSDRFVQLPVDIDSLTVRNATLAIVFKGKRLVVPFSLRVKKNSDATTGKSVPLYDCLLELQPRGQLIRIGVKADLAGNMIGIDYTADSLFLDVFSDLLSDIAPFSIVGKAVLHGTAAVQISPLQMIDIDAECKVSGARIASSAFSLRNGTAVAQPETPLHVRVSGSGKNVRVKIKDLAAVTPIAVRIPFIDGSISYANAAVDLNGNLQLEIVGSPQVDGPGKKTTPLRTALDFNGTYNPDNHDWRGEITSSEDSQDRPAQQVIYSSSAFDAVSESMSLSVAAKGSGPMGKLEYSLQLARLRVSAGEIDLRAPTVSLTGRTMIEDELNTLVAMNFSDIALAAGSMRAHGSVALTGEISPTFQKSVPKSGPVGFLGAIKLHNGTMEENESGIYAGNINAEIPVQWPFPVAAPQGDLTIDEIRWQDKNLGPLTAAVWQQGIGFVIKGVQENRLLPGLSLQFKGQTTYGGGGPKASIQFNSAMATDSVEVDLGMLHPDLQGFSLRGGVMFSGESRLDRGTLQTRVEGGLQNARFWSIETGLTIDGINTTMTIDDLLELRSRPQQQLRFDHAALGDFTIENGAIDFQIESKKSLLVEKSSFEWAGGSLYSHAIRINPGIDTYSVTIFCDRLKLADLLEQFGAAQAEGEGAVSGRVPLVYSDNRLIFGDGFLYSTPGEGGTIRMTGAEAIAAGIPKNTPQFAQIDFAMEALKNFSYKWVKLHTITEDDNLVLKMQLDGMPDRTLPFRYDSSIGEFIRVDLKTEQGILQPIRLDVNFRLPLNTLLDYSKGIGQLIDRMK